MQLEDPFDRQRRLPEIGAEGQTRISGAALEVRGADGAIIEAEYLHRAGVEVLEMKPRLEAEPFPHESAFAFAASRRVGAGAWRALEKIRRIVGVSSR